MLCPHCGSESSDKARSCPSCGYKFVLETSSDVTSDTAAQEKQLKRLFRAAFVLVTLAAIFWLATTRLSNQQSQPEQNPAMISQPIVSGRITVNARDFVAYPFSVPAACKQAKVEGDFETAANIVELLIMDDKTFANWRNHVPTTPLYSSGGLNHASLNLQLASSAKRYYFVINNRTSTRPQIVQARLNLAYRIR
jgi:zinc-ribbon domain